MTTAAEPRGFPPAVLDAPVLRGLDPRALREIEAAGRLLSLEDGEPIYRAGEGGESFYVVASGAVELRAVRRGEAVPVTVRTAAPGGSFGEEPLVGASRRAEAVSRGASRVAQIPVSLFRRAAGRSGRAEVAERLERTLRRGLARDVIAQSALGAELDPGELDAIVDVATARHVPRGHIVFEEGEPASDVLVVGEGLVQLQSSDGERIRVRGYLAGGDVLGDEALQRGARREATAVAMGATLLVEIPRDVLRGLDRRGAEPLAERLAAASRAQRAQRGAVVARAAGNATMHVFRDLYRLEAARSLLVIDLETCVRCGHCAWACGSLHGESRLVRRGDVIVTDDLGPPPPSLRDVARTWISGEPPPEADPTFDIFAAGAPKKLLLPSSCQHCENPACLIDCPTGAIGKDPRGDVFIREPLCTGCGACVRACPWDNVRLGERAPGAPRPAGSAGELVAVKCDLCRTWENGPACVQACPVGAIARIRPTDDLAEVREMFGRRRAPRAAGARAPRVPAAPLAAGAALALAGLGAVTATLARRGTWVPRSGLGLAAGVVAALALVALALYAVPKRAPRLWMGGRRRASDAGGAAGRRGESADEGADEGAEGDARPAVTSFVRPHYLAHVALGGLASVAALGHAPLGAGGSVGGALLLSFAASAGLGALSALAYALVPRRLARLERRALLPEDFAGAEASLVDRLHRELSGTSDLVKAIAGKILVPYAKHPLGPLSLVLSGRRLRDEEARLSREVEVLLDGRGRDRLAGLSRLVRTTVEMRALPAQRWMTRVLRALPPAHAALGAASLALLVIHVAGVLLR